MCQPDFQQAVYYSYQDGLCLILLKTLIFPSNDVGSVADWFERCYRTPLSIESNNKKLC